MHNFIQKSALIQQSGTSTITIAAPGAGKYICLETLTCESDADADITVVSGASTLFQCGITANAGIDKYWERVPLRGLENTSVVITVSAGNKTINVVGFVTP